MIVRILCFLLVFTFTGASHAASSVLSFDSFAKLPVQHEGRIKPMDSFARILLKRLSGQTDIGNLSAHQWLATTLFDPNSSVQIPIFSIRRDDVKARLNLSAEKSFFSFLEIASGIDATFDDIAAMADVDPMTLNPDQLELLLLHENVYLYKQALRSLSLILPLAVTVPKEYSAQQNPSFIDLQKIAPDILQSAQRKTAKDETIILAKQIETIREGGLGNILFKVIPPQWDTDSKENVSAWHSPWETILEGYGSPESKELMDQWKALAIAYQSSDVALWNETLTAISSSYKENQTRLALEVFYNSFDPFYWAQILYGLVICFALFWFASKKQMFMRPAHLCFFAAFFAHLLGLLLRVVILQRPPVSDLHESLLFISLISTFICYIYERKDKKGQGIFLAGLVGFGLLFIAEFLIVDGDSKKVLVAVLNSNFWLGVHVIIITLGYAVSLIFGLYGHAQFFTKTIHTKRLIFLGLVALLLITTGTLLGGIWADQSWGRFWGWDPKENGALLLVLWLIWVLHGRLSGHIKDTALCASASFTLILLALSWFGVNLLGVGLHSYGFISGITYGLAAFCSIDTALIAYLWYRKNRQIKNSEAA